jgi:hypothetical protein
MCLLQFLLGESAKSELGDLEEEYRFRVRNRDDQSQLWFWYELVAIAGFSISKFRRPRARARAHAAVSAAFLCCLSLLLVSPQRTETPEQGGNPLEYFHPDVPVLVPVDQPSATQFKTAFRSVIRQSENPLKYVDSHGRDLVSSDEPSATPLKTVFRSVTPQSEHPLKYDPDEQGLIPIDERSARQLRSDLDSVLRRSEAANIRVRAGRSTEVVDPAAVDLKIASPAYKSLLKVIQSKLTTKYSTATIDQEVTFANGSTGNVGHGTAIFYGDNPSRIDIYVPDASTKVVGEAGTEIEQPRYMVTAHEIFGHSVCGDENCAVDKENEIRDEVGLPRRSAQPVADRWSVDINATQDLILAAAHSAPLEVLSLRPRVSIP